MNIEVFIPIGILLISFIIGITLYYVISSQPKAEKKQELDMMISFLINFVLFIWLGKVLLNLTLFLQEPLVVLARPSDGKTFYLALVLITINILYHVLRKGLKVIPLLYTLTPVLVGASFIYEFLKVVLLTNTSTWGYLTLLLLLLIVVVSLYEKIRADVFVFMVMNIWIIGQFILGFIFPYIVVFTYLISNLFLGIVFVLLFVAFVYNYKKARL